MTGLSIDQIVPLFALVGMDKDRYAATLFWYRAGDLEVVQGSLETLEQLMMDEEERLHGLKGDPVPGVCRGLA